MSNALRSIGKVFKRIVKSKVFKIVAIAAAVYFTAGIAAGAMGVAGASSMPGIGAAMNGLGIAEGSWAAAMGVGASASAPIAGAGAAAAEVAGAAGSTAAGTAAGAVAEGAAAGFVESSTGLMIPAAEAAGEGAAAAVSSTGLVDAASLTGAGAAEAGEAVSQFSIAPESLPGGTTPSSTASATGFSGNPAQEAATRGIDTMSQAGQGAESLGQTASSEGYIKSGLQAKDVAPRTGGVFDKITDLYNGLSPGAKQILGQGLMKGGEALVKGIAGAQAQKDAERFHREQRTVWRDPTNPYVQQASSTGSGIVNAARGG